MKSLWNYFQNVNVINKIRPQNLDREEYAQIDPALQLLALQSADHNQPGI